MTVDGLILLSRQRVRRRDPPAYVGSPRQPRLRKHPRLLNIFHATGVRATFFILGWWPSVSVAVARIAAAGHEIASHGYGHRLVST